MKNFKERMADVSQYLQQLMDPSVFTEVQNAVEKKDKKSLMEVCSKVKIPEIYTGVIVSVLLSIGPQQIKWPAPWF